MWGQDQKTAFWSKGHQDPPIQLISIVCCLTTLCSLGQRQEDWRTPSRWRTYRTRLKWCWVNTRAVNTLRTLHATVACCSCYRCCGSCPHSVSNTSSSSAQSATHPWRKCSATCTKTNSSDQIFLPHGKVVDLRTANHFY